MNLEHLLKVQPKRINPFQGLIIDVPTWTEAHEYHVLLHRIHSMALHRPGFISGLSVSAWDPPDGSVVIHPGVALDPEGSLIMVPEKHRLHIEPRGNVLVHIVLQYREVPYGSSQPTQGGDKQPTHIMHAYRLLESTHLPTEPHLELGRVLLSGRPLVIKDAADPVHPGTNEIDLRYRPEAGPQAKGHIKVGQVLHGAEGQLDVHSQGLRNLVTALGRFTEYTAELVGAMPLHNGPPDCSLLFLNGTGDSALGDAELAVLGSFLDRGGVVVGEACRRQGTDAGTKAFDVAFARMGEKLGRKLRKVGKGHPLLDAHYLFADQPQGIDGAPLLMEERGLVFSGTDYGCVWAGEGAERPLSREEIRSALELGINLLVYALDRTTRARLRIS